MSNQSYYGYTNAQTYPQQQQYAQAPPQANYNYAPYPQPYGHQQDYRAPQDNYYAGPEGQVGPDGERGLGATLVGGGAAGWAAHKAGKGWLGSAASAGVGAVAANFLESKLKKHRNKHNKQ